MDRVNAVGAGVALGVTFAFLGILCALAFILVPDGAIDFFGAFMHGLDLNSVRSTAPIRFGRVLYGVIGLSIIGFIAGFVFAWTYNLVNRH
jgi:tetrahydromethanopterin S-methyltransferase subunit F